MTPATVPTRPRLSKAAAGRHHTVKVRWRAAQGRGRVVTAYQVIGPKRKYIVRGTSLRAVLRGLPRKRSLRIGVRAHNAVGWSDVSWSRTIRTRR